MSAHNTLKQLASQPSVFEMPDPGNGKAIVPDRHDCLVLLRTTAAETRTLPAPWTEGLRLTLSLETDGGDCVVTASAAINRAGNTIMTFDNVRETITLVAVRSGGARYWMVQGNDGVGLS
jgi:hypothetical protein